MTQFSMEEEIKESIRLVKEGIKESREFLVEIENNISNKEQLSQLIFSFPFERYKDKIVFTLEKNSGGIARFLADNKYENMKIVEDLFKEGLAIDRWCGSNLFTLPDDLKERTRVVLGFIERTKTYLNKVENFIEEVEEFQKIKTRQNIR